MQRTDSLEKTLMLRKIEDRRRRGRHRMRSLNGHEFEWTPGVGDGQGSLPCYSPWGCKESDTIVWLELNWMIFLPLKFILFLQFPQLLEKSLAKFAMCEVHSRHDSSLLVIFLWQRWQFITVFLILVRHILVKKEALPSHCRECHTTIGSAGTVAVWVKVHCSGQLKPEPNRHKAPPLLSPRPGSVPRPEPKLDIFVFFIFFVSFCYLPWHSDICWLLK